MFAPLEGRKRRRAGAAVAGGWLHAPLQQSAPRLRTNESTDVGARPPVSTTTNQRVLRIGCDRAGHPSYLYMSNIRGAGQEATHDSRPPARQPTHSSSQGQAGRDQYPGANAAAQGLYGQVRRQVGLPPHSDSSRPSSFSGIPLRSSTLSMEGPSIRPLDSPIRFCQNDEGHPTFDSRGGHQVQPVHGRLAAGGTIEGATPSRPTQDVVDLSRAGVGVITRQVSDTANAAPGVLGIPSGHHWSTCPQDSCLQETISSPFLGADTQEARNYQEAPCSSAGLLCGHDTCVDASQATTQSSLPTPQVGTGVGRMDPAHSTSERRSIVVLPQLQDMGWGSTLGPGSSQGCDRDRRLTYGVGRSSQAARIASDTSGRALDSRALAELQQSPGTDSGTTRPPILPPPPPASFVGEDPLGQYHDGGVHQQVRGQIRHPRRGGEDNTATRLDEILDALRETYSGPAERDSGPAVSSSRQGGLEAKLDAISVSGEFVGAPYDRPIRDSDQQADPPVQLGNATTGVRGNRRADARLEQREQLDQSTVAPDPSGAEQAPQRESASDCNSALVARAILVAAHAEAAAGPTRAPTAYPRDISSLPPYLPNARTVKIAKLACYNGQTFWEQILAHSDFAAGRSQIVKSLSNPFLAMGFRICKFLQYSVNLPLTPAQVIAFLSTVITPGRPASVLSTAVGAIRLLHDMFGLPSPFSNHVMTTYVRGMLIDNTIKPVHHRAVFDMERLIQAILFRNEMPEQLHGDDLRRRTMLLTAIALLARPSDLRRIEVQFIHERGGVIEMVLGKSKTDRSRDGVAVQVPFLGQRAISAADFIKHVAQLENAPSMPNPGRLLFHKASMPTKELGAQRIAKLLREELAKFGTFFGAASIRPSTTTFAATANADMYDISKQGRWADTAVMKRCYDQSSRAALTWGDCLDRIIAPNEEPCAQLLNSHAREDAVATGGDHEETQSVTVEDESIEDPQTMRLDTPIPLPPNFHQRVPTDQAGEQEGNQTPRRPLRRSKRTRKRTRPGSPPDEEDV